MQWIMVGLGVGTMALVTIAIQHQETLEGRLLPKSMRGQTPWQTISVEQMERGASANPDTNVIIQIPDEAADMTLDVLTGYRGKTVRFWGYCFPKGYESDPTTERRIPGTIFLSKRERELRKKQQLNERLKKIKITRDVEQEDLNQERTYRGEIRHQQEIFHGGTTCYLMSEAPLPIGTDADDDEANSAVERDTETDPQNADSDSDGVSDGRETFYLGTNPVLRDSDGDGLIDGIEDSDHNGHRDLDETDALKLDTDSDGLCDGLCKIERGKKLRGEDKNLNGTVDDGETSPLLIESDGDGILDSYEVYLCELAKGTNC